MLLPEQEVIETKSQKIDALLLKHRLKEAINEIKEMAQWGQLADTIVAMEEMETTYCYMLRYMEEGYADPEREKHYIHLFQNALYWSDITKDKLLLNSSRDYFYVRKRYHKETYIRMSGKEYTNYLPELLESLKSHYQQMQLVGERNGRSENQQSAFDAIRRVYEEELSRLFEIVWTAVHIKHFSQHYNQLIASSDYPLELRLLAASSLTLSLTTYFEAEKLDALLLGSHSEESELRQRSLTGLLIARYYHAPKMVFFPELLTRIAELFEDEKIKGEVKYLLLGSEFGRSTERIAKFMTEEVYPEIVKSNPHIRNSEDENNLDKNPEWNIENSAITEKLEQVNKLQNEGLDVFFSSFSSLKSYPFFYSIANWFTPFSPNNSIINRIFPDGEIEQERVLRMITAAKSLCDSDKYSFSLSIEQMSPSQRDMLAQQFTPPDSEMEQMDEEDSIVPSRTPNPLIVGRLYMQSCYRFFALNLHWRGHINPLKSGLCRMSDPLYTPLFDDHALLILLMSYYIEIDEFSAAITAVNRLIDLGNPSSTLYQKKGYCHEQLNEREKAMEAYLRAEILAPDNTWTLRRIAALADDEIDSNLALDYYKRALTNEPDHVPTLLHLAAYYVKIGRCNDALNCFYKVDFLRENHLKALRGIAWCSLLLRKGEEGERTIEKIISQNPNASDWLNAGHIACLNGNLKEGVGRYRKAAKLLENELEKFQEIFEQDRPALIQAGIPQESIDKLPDLVRFTTSK